jgi:hypothetical protein
MSRKRPAESADVFFQGFREKEKEKKAFTFAISVV